MWRHEQLSIKMAVSCAVHHIAHRFCFDAAVQTVDFNNISDDEDNVPEYVTPARVVEHPAPALTVHAAPALVIEYVAAALANEFLASAPVSEDVAPAPVLSLLEPSVPVVHVVQVPQVLIIEKTVEFPVVQTA